MNAKNQRKDGRGKKFGKALKTAKKRRKNNHSRTERKVA